MLANIIPRCVFRRSDLLNICVSFVKLKCQACHKNILLPLSTYHVASTFQVMWKLHTFIHPLESLAYRARKKNEVCS